MNAALFAARARIAARLPLVLAVVVTLANAVKPATVDDTAYLLFARHISTDPTNPYGFTIFWWEKPDPAMEVLCPPVVPYWLALGIRLVGEHVPLLKLWLFPFVLLLAWALNGLLARFARGAERVGLAVLMLSPAVLPTVNLMLDVPAVALALASVELFIRAVVRRSGWLVVLAGCVAGLAMQTKYSAFVAPAVIAWFGLTHRRFWPALVAVGVCVAVFVGWELLLVAKYGQSHFAFHAGSSGGGGLRAFAEQKFSLLAPLSGYLGGLAVGAGLLAVSALRVPRRWLGGIVGVWCFGFVLVTTLPRRWTVFGPDFFAVSVYWQLGGLLWAAAVAGCLCVLLFRVRKGIGLRANRDTLFLAGWLMIEVVAALGLTPFPAARRVIGVSLVMGLVAARAASRLGRVDLNRRVPQWVGVVGIGAGVLIAAIDVLDAFPEKLCAEGAAALVAGEKTGEQGAEPETWFVGHWGFQYYCERYGMRPLIAGGTVARAGDFLVIPAYPPGDYFPRPYAGF
ncbi:MAG TPA: glycosyltransferase family 39 protein, partial [Gemmata sp.]